MKNFRLFLRRLSVFLGAMLAAAAALLAVATPASAHHSTVYGEAACDTSTGNWIVSWTVTNSMSNLSAVLTTVVATPDTPITNIFVGAFLPKKGDGPLIGTQTLSGAATEAKLGVQAKWTNGFEEGKDGKDPELTTVTLGGTCEEDQPSPHATFTSACDGRVTVTLSNDPEARKAAAFTVNGEDGFSETKTVPAGESAEVVVPADSAAQIAVLVGTKEFATYSWKEPEDCAPVKLASRSDCTALTVALENPQGNRPANVTVTSGTATENVTIAAGETKELTFPATAGTTATVTFAGAEPATITWEDPGDCNPPPPLGLPDTGVQLSGLVGVGVALIGVGAVLLVVLRRRRLTNPS